MAAPPPPLLSGTPLPDDAELPSVDGLDIPRQFHWARVQAPPLAGMQLPAKDTPWQELHRIGFRWVACLCSERPLYNPHPLGRLVSVELSDLDETKLPEEPEAEERAIRSIADAVVRKLDAGEGVIVHCAGGRGRTGTILGVVLVRLGCSPAETVAFLDRVHRSRGKPGWPESKWQSDLVGRTVNRTPCSG